MTSCRPNGFGQNLFFDLRGRAQHGDDGERGLAGDGPSNSPGGIGTLALSALLVLPCVDKAEVDWAR